MFARNKVDSEPRSKVVVLGLEFCSDLWWDLVWVLIGLLDAAVCSAVLCFLSSVRIVIDCIVWLHCLFLCFFLVSDQRIWVVLDVAFLRWFNFVNSKGSSSFNSKGLFFWNRLSWWSCTWFFDISDLLRSAGFKTLGLPPLRYCLIHFNIYDCYQTVCSKERLCLLFYLGGCWYVDHNK